jgi:ATP-dependent DNA helicase RecG
LEIICNIYTHESTPIEFAPMNKSIPRSESDTVEFKTSFSEEVIVTLVAFANSKGGSVYIGVTDSGKVKGVQTGKETIVFWLNEIKNKTAPVLIPDVEEMQAEEKNVVRLCIAEYPIKPVSTKGRYYKRTGNANHQLSTSEVADMHLRAVNTSWDAYLDLQHGVEDLSLDKVQKTIDRRNRLLTPVQDDPLTFLYKCGLIREDKITHAAFFLFHTEDSYLSAIELGRFQDEITIKDSARSKQDALTQIEQVIEFVKKHINLEVIITGEPQNTQRWQYPLEAVREIVINMVLHRDYHSSSDSIVKVFDDKIEFYNPGRLPQNITVEDLLSGHYRSTPRNKLMADFFKEIGLIEKYGSGIRRIMDHCRDAGLPQPSFTNISDGFMVTIYSRNAESKTESRLNGLYGNKEQISEPFTPYRSERSSEKSSEKILRVLRENPQVTIASLSETIGITTRAVEKQLSRMKAEGKIRREGPDKGGHWRVKE